MTACAIPAYFVPASGNLRSSHSLRYDVPTTSLDAYKYSYFPRTFRIWNILPEEIVGASSPDIFKQTLHQAFVDGHMHTVAPKDTRQRPRLGSTRVVSAVGPVY